MELNESKSGVSILICTYNGKNRLATTLKALSQQNTSSIPNVELLLIDNASTDGTSQFVIEEWQNLHKPFPLKIITEPTPGKINAQERGLTEAGFKYALICDDDNALFPDYLSRGYELLLSNPKIGALGGQGIAVSENKLPEWFSEYAYHFACAPQAPKTGEVQPVRNVIYGAGMFINLEGWRKVKAAGFKYLLPSRIGKQLVTGAEDGEVCWSLRFAGYEIWYAEELKFYHHLPASRLTEEYRTRLLSALYVGSVAGKLYPRVYRKELTKPIRCFWLKELIYTLIYVLKLPFVNVKDKKLDFERSLFQAKYLLKQRDKYDESLVYLLKLKRTLAHV